MTKNAKIILSFLAIALLVGFGIYYSLINKNAVITGEPVPVDTASLKGCYVASLSKDFYTLKIQSEENGNIRGMLAYNNYQKDSSSGSFSGTFANDILLGNYSFDSEGMHSDRLVIFKKVGDNFVQGFGPTKVVEGKEEFTNTAAVTYDPKSTFIKSADCLLHFIDANQTFSFDYNAFFQVISPIPSPVLDWRLDSKVNGVLLAILSIPRTYLPGTNFADARLTVGRSSAASAIKSCTVVTTTNNEKSVGAATVGGFPFSKFTSNGAGAGNFYETTSYRGIVDGDCYAIEYTIHSTNIGNYSPDQGIKEFDKIKIQTELENIIKSLKFLINSD